MTSFGVAEGLALVIISATVMAYLARKSGQPTVIAYLATGLLIGPAGFSMVSQSELTGLISELGLVFLLFLIGLEIDIDEIREILRPTILIGVLQMAATFAAGLAVSVALGFSVFESLFIGAATMFSSTALVVKLLSDKNQSSTLPGRLDIGILLVQDVVVVLILALLSTGAGNLETLAIEFSKILAVIVGISTAAIGGARYVLPKLLEKTDTTPQSFFIYGVAWAFIFITASTELNISAEIGAFAAGLGLAQLPYDRELQERVRPLTDFFMAIFFIDFGLGLTGGELAAVLPQALIASGLLMAAKFGIIFALVDWRKFTPETSFIGAVNMTQISEFGLILGGLAASQGFIGAEVVAFLSLIAIITMGLSSYLLRFNNELYEAIEHLLERFESEEKKDVEVRELENHAVVVGFDETMRALIPVLKERFGQVVVVDNDSNKAEELSRKNVEYIFGNFLHGELRKSTRIEDAGIVISGAPGFQLNKKIAEEVPKEVTLFLRATDFEDAAELYEMGAHYVIIENMVAAEQVSDYIELWLDDPELFAEEVESDLEKLHWGGRNG